MHLAHQLVRRLTELLHLIQLGEDCVTGHAAVALLLLEQVADLGRFVQLLVVALEVLLTKLLPVGLEPARELVLEGFHRRV